MRTGRACPRGHTLRRSPPRPSMMTATSMSSIAARSRSWFSAVRGSCCVPSARDCSIRLTGCASTPKATSGRPIPGLTSWSSSVPRGRVLMVLGRRGQPDLAKERFDRPTDVAFGANGDVYIADGYGNSRVVKYSKDGDYLGEWGKKGVDQGEFNTPHGIITDKDRPRLCRRSRELPDPDFRCRRQVPRAVEARGVAVRIRDERRRFSVHGRRIQRPCTEAQPGQRQDSRRHRPSRPRALADSTSSITWRSTRTAVSTPPRSLLSAVQRFTPR